MKSFKKQTRKILILGGSSIFAMNLMRLSKDYYSIINKKLYQYPENKRKILKLYEKRLITINLRKPDLNLKKLNKYNTVINCLGSTSDFNNDNYNLYQKKKEFNNYKFKILKIVEAVNCVNFIHIGSSREYKRKDIPQPEKVKTKPDTNYGKYKQFEHLSFKSILKNKNLKYYNLRVFSIYGMYLKKKNLIAEMLKTKKRKFCNKRIDLINFEYLNNIIMSIIKNTTTLKKKSIINCCSNNIIDIKKILTIFPHKLCDHKKCKNTRSYLGKSDVLPNIGILKFDVLKNLRKLKKSKHLIKFF